MRTRTESSNEKTRKIIPAWERTTSEKFVFILRMTILDTTKTNKNKEKLDRFFQLVRQFIEYELRTVFRIDESY